MTEALDPRGIFESLREVAPAGADLVTQPLPGFTPIEVGVTKDGQAAIVAPMHVAAEATLSPVRLAYLHAFGARECTVRRGADTSREDLLIITCTTEEPSLQDWFLRVGTSLLADAIKQGSEARVNHAINELAELFEHAVGPPRKTALGLWAELAVLAWARKPVEAASAWRVVPHEPFDFGSDNDRVEVKATTSQSREHFFSVSQIRAPGKRVRVISIISREMGGGVSILDLTQMVRDKLAGNAQLARKVDEVVLTTLGTHFATAGERRFDLELARQSRRLFSGQHIPCVELPLPPAIREVRMLISLQRCEPMIAADVRREGSLASALSWS